MTKLLFVSGSLRAASSSTATCRAFIEALGARADCNLAEIGSLPLYNADHDGGAPVAAWKDAVEAAGGLVFVTPEYNYSVPGVLKNAIDWASRPAYVSVFKGKPCLVVSVSGGALGGVRAQSHLKYILHGMLADVFPCQEVVIPHAPKKVENGVLADEAAVSFGLQTLEAFIGRVSG